MAYSPEFVSALKRVVEALNSRPPALRGPFKIAGALNPPSNTYSAPEQTAEQR